MNDSNDFTQPNDPAFPTPVNTEFTAGLTIREYFAAMAMQGVLSANSEFEGDIPTYSVKMADALIKELNKNA